MAASEKASVVVARDAPSTAPIVPIARLPQSLNEGGTCVAYTTSDLSWAQGWRIMYNELVYLSIPRLSLCVALENSIMMRHP